jgi:hypothetical protein
MDPVAWRPRVARDSRPPNVSPAALAGGRAPPIGTAPAHVFAAAAPACVASLRDTVLRRRIVESLPTPPAETTHDTPCIA